MVVTWFTAASNGCYTGSVEGLIRGGVAWLLHGSVERLLHSSVERLLHSRCMPETKGGLIYQIGIDRDAHARLFTRRGSEWRNTQTSADNKAAVAVSRNSRDKILVNAVSLCVLVNLTRSVGRFKQSSTCCCNWGTGVDRLKYHPVHMAARKRNTRK